MVSLDTITVQINKVEDSLSLIDSTVKFHLTIQWAVLTFVIATAGGALYLMARHWFEKGLDKRVQSIKDELLKEINREIPKVQSITLIIGGTAVEKNATRVQIEKIYDDVNPHVLIQPQGNKGDLEIYRIPKSLDYMVINNKPYVLSFDVLIFNGSLKLGRIPAYTSEEAMKIIKEQ